MTAFEPVGDVLVVAPIGHINSENATALETELLQHVDQGHHRIVLDFGQVDYVSSAGLRVVLMLAKQLRQVAGRLVLSGLQPQVREVFDISGFLTILKVAETRAAALTVLAEG